MFGRRMVSIVIAMVVAGAFGVAGGKARAGRYHVYSCRTPDGGVAPVDGWSGVASGTYVYAEDKCDKGGALIAALDDGIEHPSNTDISTWTFSTPPEEALVGARIWRAGDADGGLGTGATYEFWLSGPTETDVFDECVYTTCLQGVGEFEEPLSGSNYVALAESNLGSDIYLNAACYGTLGHPCQKGEHDPNGYAAVVYLYAADLTLEQTAQPSVSEVSGELADAQTLSGTSGISFHAEDPGAGVYEAVFTVDGERVGGVLLDENGGRCRDVGETTDGLPAFLYLHPCRASLAADVPFDTTSLTDGSHRLVVSIVDAAGNDTVALDRRITVSNHPASTEPETPSSSNQQPTPGQSASVGASGAGGSAGASAQQASPPNGTNATAGVRFDAHWSATAKTALAGFYGHPHTIVGKLSSTDGSPIGNAVIQVLDTPEYEHAKARSLPDVRTAADGSFRIKLPASTPSSRVTLAYSKDLGQAAPDAIATLRLTVGAKLSLKVTPSVAHAGSTIAFSGTLLGSPLPPGGKQLVLEARVSKGPWRQFRALATGKRGRYRATYRFRLGGPITYQFRAVSPKEADFPYGVGSSNVVRVHER